MAEPRKGLVEKSFAEHRRALQAFFYQRIRTKSDAPDLAQEVCVRMLRVNDIHAIRDPERYLYTVASNLVKEYAVLDRWQTRGVNLDEASIQQRLGELPTLDGQLDPEALDVTLDSPFLYTPETTVSFAADLPIRTAFGEIDLHADYAWREDQTFAYWETLARQDAYGLLNAMIVARFEDTDFELQLWGKNLTDERYVDRSVDLGSLVNAVPGDPRTYGASLTYRFGPRLAAE